MLVDERAITKHRKTCLRIQKIYPTETMNILVFNAGSASLKFEVIQAESSLVVTLAKTQLLYGSKFVQDSSGVG